MPDEVPEELRPIVHDVNTASPVRMVVRSAPPGDRFCGDFWLEVTGASGLIGFNPGQGETVAEGTLTAADQVHDWVLECLPELGLPAVWPECPEHPASHPLRVGAGDDVPVWECPRSGTTHARVGELGRPRAGR